MIRGSKGRAGIVEAMLQIFQLTGRPRRSVERFEKGGILDMQLPWIDSDDRAYALSISKSSHIIEGPEEKAVMYHIFHAIRGT